MGNRQWTVTDESQQWAVQATEKLSMGYKPREVSSEQ